MRNKKKSVLESMWIIPVIVTVLVIFIIGVIKMYGKSKKTCFFFQILDVQFYTVDK